MTLGINTNVASINAQNALSRSQGQNDQALERLSSGLRINSAADDAAGLAISTRFESQISGQQVASRNAQDGISLAQTAEGALDEITNNLQRVRELAVQSANATNNASDRQALDDEVQQRIEEIDRIASQTEFNGLNVLDGTLGGQDFQVGANRGQTIEVNLEDGARASQIGQLAEAELQLDADQFDAEGALTSDLSFDITVGDNDTVTINAQQGDTLDDIRGRVEAEGIDGVTDVSITEGEEVPAGSETLEFEDFSLATGESATFALTPDGTTTAQDFTLDNTGDGSIADVVAGIDGLADFSAEDNGDGTITITNDNGDTFELVQSGDPDFSAVGFDEDVVGSGETLGEADFAPGSLDLQADEEFTVVDGAAAGVFSNVSDTSGMTVELDGSLNAVDVQTVETANDAISRVDTALDSVNSIRSELGAVQNRFESTIANLDNSVENLSSANSRIRDADFAAESANLSQSQVLQQAGISVLSQANARPQQVLALLQ